MSKASIRGTQIIACELCAETRSAPRFVVDGWQIVDCARCGMRYVNPRLEDEFYENGYDASYYSSTNSVRRGYRDYAAEESQILRTFSKRWQEISPFIPVRATPARHLDIGCAHGYALTVSAHLGLDSMGVDVSAFAVDRARQHGRLVVRGAAREAKAAFCQRELFSVVTSWDVIEHTCHPLDHLIAIADMLEPAGIVSLVTPDRGSAPARILGRRWVEYRKPEEHLYFFRLADIQRMMTMAGLKILSVSRVGKYVSTGTLLGHLGDYASPLRALRSLQGMLPGTVYVNPFDKMHVIAQKPPADSPCIAPTPSTPQPPSPSRKLVQDSF